MKLYLTFFYVEQSFGFYDLTKGSRSLDNHRS